MPRHRGISASIVLALVVVALVLIGGARTFKPEVVICDIGLPSMDGYAVAKALRADANLRSARLVALSGYARPKDLQRSAAAGFDAHIAKPASVEAIEEALYPLGKDGNRDG